MLYEKLEVGDTVRTVAGGPLMTVEGFEPFTLGGKFRGEKGLVHCVVIYTNDRKDSEKERFKIPRFILEKRRRRWSPDQVPVVDVTPVSDETP